MSCLYPIAEFIYKHAPAPGVLPLILAVVAAVVSTPMVVDRIKGSWWGHAVLFVALGCIAALEIMVISHADRVSEERITHLNDQVSITVNNTTDIQRQLGGYINAQTLAVQAQNEKERHHKISDSLMELKSNTAKLSANIFELLFLRTQMAPTQGKDFQQYAAQSFQFDKETLIWYQEKYGTDARRVVDDLKSHGLGDDPRLEAAVQNVSSVRDIEIIATHLAAQAERITPEGVKPITRLIYP